VSQRQRKPAQRRKPAARRAPVKPAAPDLRPLKIVGDLYAKHVDEKGETVGEAVIGQVVIYAPVFDQLRETVEGQWPRLVAEFLAQPAPATILEVQDGAGD